MKFFQHPAWHVFLSGICILGIFLSGCEGEEDSGKEADRNGNKKRQEQKKFAKSSSKKQKAPLPKEPLLLAKKGSSSEKKDEKKVPKIHFARKFIEFGSAIQGEEVVQVFTFQNQGEAPLRIAKIKSSCLCAPTLLSKKVLNPGEKGKIKVIFKTMGLSSQYYDLAIDVYHNDPAEQDSGQFVTRLNLSGQVVMLYKITPPGAQYLGSFESKYPPRRTFRIVPLKSKGFTIKKIEYPTELAEVKATPETLSGGVLAQKVVVTIRKNQPPGEYLCPIKFFISDPRQPVIFFKVWGQALGDILYEPNYLLFGPTRRDGRMDRPITIYQRKGVGLEILKVHCDRNFFDVKIEEMLEKKKFEVTLTIKKDAPAGPFGKTLLIYTNNPHQPILSATVLGSLESQLKIFPPGVYISSAQGKSTIQITGPQDLQVKLGEKKYPPSVTPDLKKVSPGRYRLHLEWKGAEPKNLSAFVMLITNLPGEKEIKIPLAGRPAK